MQIICLPLECLFKDLHLLMHLRRHSPASNYKDLNLISGQRQQPQVNMNSNGTLNIMADNSSVNVATQDVS